MQLRHNFKMLKKNSKNAADRSMSDEPEQFYIFVTFGHSRG